MDKTELLKLEKIYSELPDEKLAELLLADQSEYDSEAYELLLAEGRKRNIEPKVIELKKEKESETPFRWGNFVIGVSFLQGTIALIFGGILGIKTEYLPKRLYSIILGLISLSYAYGLMKRKRWGLNILLILYYLEIPLFIILGIVERSIESIVGGIGLSIVAFLNLIYFRKRKHMFN